MASKYEVKRALGQGGMGAVYEAVHKELKRPCALKVLKPELVDHVGARKRFEREVQVMASLNHPNIVKIFDAGVSPKGCYMAMEYVPGRSLDRILKNRVLELDEAVAIGEAMLSALAYMHERGVVHRDLKPANVMVTDGGEVKVMDFGLVFVDDRTRLTRTGEAVGTIRYMPPEILRGLTSDGRSDLYQWAAIFFECLTGEYFCAGKNQGELVLRILEGDPPSLLAIRPELPEALDRVVAWAGAREPADRPADAETLRRALLRAAGVTAANEADLSRTVTDLPSLAELGLPEAEAFELEGESSFPDERRGSGSFRRPPRSVPAVPSAAAPVRVPSVRTRLVLGGVFLLVGLAALLALFLRGGDGGAVRPHLESLRAEPFLCHVVGRHLPGAVVPWRITEGDAPLRQGRVSASPDGRFEITIRGLDDDRRYVLHLGDSGAVAPGRRFDTPPFRIVDGPWARSGPHWLEMGWTGNGRCILDVEVDFLRSKQTFKGRRSSKEELEGRVSFTGLPFDRSAAARFRVRLFRGDRLLAEGELPPAVRDVLPLPRWADLDEPVPFARNGAIAGDTAVYADQAGLVYAIDCPRIFAFPPPTRMPISWIEAVVSRPGFERTHARSGALPACGGCAAWGERVAVITNRPTGLRVLSPAARRKRWAAVLEAMKGRAPEDLVLRDLPELDRLLTTIPPARGEDEFGLDLEVKGVCFHGGAMRGDVLTAAWNAGKNGSTVLSVDLARRVIVARRILPFPIVASPVVLRGEILIRGLASSRRAVLVGLGEKDLDERWRMACRGMIPDRVWVEEDGSRFSYADGESLVCLAAPSPVRGERDVRRIAFVGDSFTYGWGIEQVEDRFTDRIQVSFNSRSGDRVEVMNVAKPGWDTQQELQPVADMIDAYGVDEIVLCYVPNDIEGLIPTSPDFDPTTPPDPTWFNPDASYLLTQMYQRLWLPRLPTVRGYHDWLAEGVGEPTIWRRHERQLGAMGSALP